MGNGFTETHYMKILPKLHNSKYNYFHCSIIICCMYAKQIFLSSLESKEMFFDLFEQI